jgi:hypothetical protein
MNRRSPVPSPSMEALREDHARMLRVLVDRGIVKLDDDFHPVVSAQDALSPSVASPSPDKMEAENTVTQLRLRVEAYDRIPKGQAAWAGYDPADREIDQEAISLIHSLSARLREVEGALEREREECAKVAEETGHQLCSARDGEPWIVMRIAAAIRARSLTKPPGESDG